MLDSPLNLDNSILCLEFENLVVTGAGLIINLIWLLEGMHKVVVVVGGGVF